MYNKNNNDNQKIKLSNMSIRLDKETQDNFKKLYNEYNYKNNLSKSQNDFFKELLNTYYNSLVISNNFSDMQIFISKTNDLSDRKNLKFKGKLLYNINRYISLNNTYILDRLFEKYYFENDGYCTNTNGHYEYNNFNLNYNILLYESEINNNYKYILNYQIYAYSISTQDMLLYISDILLFNKIEELKEKQKEIIILNNTDINNIANLIAEEISLDKIIQCIPNPENQNTNL